MLVEKWILIPFNTCKLRFMTLVRVFDEFQNVFEAENNFIFSFNMIKWDAYKLYIINYRI